MTCLLQVIDCLLRVFVSCQVESTDFLNELPVRLVGLYYLLGRFCVIKSVLKLHCYYGSIKGVLICTYAGTRCLKGWGLFYGFLPHIKSNCVVALENRVGLFINVLNFLRYVVDK